MKKIFCYLFLVICTKAFAQTADTNLMICRDTAHKHLGDVDAGWPKFKGNLSHYFAMNIEYPQVEREAGVMGTVYLSFNVETDGSITNVKVEKGVPNGPGLDEEAVRVITKMPKWTPGMRNGRAVRALYYLPIHFELR